MEAMGVRPWLTAVTDALQDASLTSAARKRLQWQAMQLAASGPPEAVHPSVSGPGEPDSAISDVEEASRAVALVAGFSAPHVGDAVRWLKERGADGLASRLRRRSRVRNRPAHPDAGLVADLRAYLATLATPAETDPGAAAHGQQQQQQQQQRGTAASEPGPSAVIVIVDEKPGEAAAYEAEPAEEPGSSTADGGGAPVGPDPLTISDLWAAPGSGGNRPGGARSAALPICCSSTTARFGAVSV